MKQLKFPEISKKIQQSIYGAYGGSGSDDFWDQWDDGELLDPVIIGGGDNSDYGDDYGDGNNDNDYYGGGDSGSGGNTATGIPDYDENGDYIRTETDWSLDHPIEALKVYSNAGIAEDAARLVVMECGSDHGTSLHNGYGDALRHALWNALNTEAIGGQMAIDIAQAHENSNPNEAAEAAMDAHNNAWGVNYGVTNDSWGLDDFLEDFNTAVENGEIEIINQETIPEDLNFIVDFDQLGSEGTTDFGNSYSYDQGY